MVPGVRGIWIEFALRLKTFEPVDMVDAVVDQLWGCNPGYLKDDRLKRKLPMLSRRWNRSVRRY